MSASGLSIDGERQGRADTGANGLPTSQQSALLIALLIDAREKELESKGGRRRISRARISQNTIRKLCRRAHLPDSFLQDLQLQLLAAGWALFCASPSHFGVVKVESVQGWGRISSKRIARHLDQVARGSFPWKEYEHLLLAAGDGSDELEDVEAEREGQETEE